MYLTKEIFLVQVVVPVLTEDKVLASLLIIFGRLPGKGHKCITN